MHNTENMENTRKNMFRKAVKMNLGIIFFLILCLKSEAQVYYDSTFNKLPDRNNAAYYKIADSTESVKTVKTYYITDTLKDIEYFTGLNYNICNGKFLSYYKNGKLKYEINYLEDKRNGEFRGYYENGNLRRLDNYKQGDWTNGICFTQNGKDTTYFVYEKSACYEKGDLIGFRNFVVKHLKYPEAAARRKIQGKVVVQFIINNKGEVVDIKVKESPDELLSQAAVKAVAASRKWEPGIQEGKKVKQLFSIPIDFRLN